MMSNFKSVLLCLLALLLAIPAVAQKDKSKKQKKEEQKQEAIYNLIAQETCDCMADKDVSNMKSEDIEMNLGLCMLGSFSKHSGELGGEADLSNDTAMEALGEKIGILMFGKCPQTLMAVATSMQAESDPMLDDLPPMLEESAEWDGGGELTGAIVRMSNTGDVSYLVLKDEAGVEHELMWLRYFDGSEPLLENPEAGIGRKAMIYWVPMEIYSPKTKDYAVRKEIRALTFVE
ncbi:MAG: hypothetical protein SGI94_00180 [Saprospiraceae bacterium]|nr:hypothetical protein [Saprospiraceae bacterium]